MKLVELFPQLLAVGEPNSYGGYQLRHVQALDQADGIRFQCPRCLKTSSHEILIPFQGKKLHEKGWAVSGTGLNDLTLTPSISLPVEGNGCGFHGFVTNGEVTEV